MRPCGKPLRGDHVFKCGTRRSVSDVCAHTMGCYDAEFAISLELDDRLSGRDRRLLRAHLGSCGECRAIARCYQAQRQAIRALAAIPVPGVRKFRHAAASP
jgi:anti-sigma factor RsiW